MLPLLGSYRCSLVCFSLNLEFVHDPPRSSEPPLRDLSSCCYLPEEPSLRPRSQIAYLQSESQGSQPTSVEYLSASPQPLIYASDHSHWTSRSFLDFLDSGFKLVVLDVLIVHIELTAQFLQN